MNKAIEYMELAQDCLTEMLEDAKSLNSNLDKIEEIESILSKLECLTVRTNKVI